jgi:DNA polymerase I
MIVHKHSVAGQPVTINVVETPEDLQAFRDFIAEHEGMPLGVDSETTGLDIYSDKFRIRVLQVGTDRESFVIPVERGEEFLSDASYALENLTQMVLHNAAYDLQVFDRCLGIPMESLWPKVTDTRILAHLIDPRGKEEGGLGHSLEELTRHYIDADVADGVKTLMKDLAADNRTTVANVWKKVPFEDPRYQLYSGMDPILAIRLYQALLPTAREISPELIPYEHKLAEVCSYMERKGFLLDVEYSEDLSERLTLRENRYKEIADDFGCEKVGSTDQVADVLEAQGVAILERTPSGKRKVDDTLLSELATSEKASVEVRTFADAVIEAKKASKWRTTWVDTFLRERDSQDRCHASINPLRARTARMSITGIPAQTLPAGDSTIRRCFVADEGHRIASVDYQAQELRVLAALSGDRTMTEALLRGDDLHLLTARAAFGEHIQKDDKERKWGKGANFSRVYGGGAKTVADQNHLDLYTASKIIAGFDKAYPAVKVLSAKLQKEATATGYVRTPNGRRLPVDKQRAYSALNYLIQSTSRDVTARALLRLDEAGFTPYLRLPIHDEVLVSIPEEKARWGAEKIGEIMTETIGGMPITTDPEVGLRSWGSLYGADE